MSISCCEADLVVRVLHVDAELLQREDGLAAHVRAGVERRQVEVAALVEISGTPPRGGRSEVEVLELGADVEVVKPMPSARSSVRRSTWRGSPS